jgi:putative endonuclease
LEDVLVFVEVRARSTSAFGSPAETVDHRKQKRLTRAAAAYLARFPPGEGPMTRFDVVAVIDDGPGPPAIEIFPDAFPARR